MGCCCDFASVDVAVGQCSLCDKKRNVKLYTNLTGGEHMPLNVLPLAHFDFYVQHNISYINNMI